jgi:MFS family permease
VAQHDPSRLDSASAGGAAKARSDGRLEHLLRAFRHRNYRLFFSGQLVSVCGTWMQVVAQSWLVYRLTGSAVLLGLVGFCSQIPVLLLSPVAGVAADRYDRRRIIVATQVASMLLAFALATLTLSGWVRVWHIPVLAALLGVVNAFDVPTRQAFVVDMVGKDDLVNAIALNSSMFNGARILGPSLAGVLVASLGEGWCFFANAVSYLAVIVGLMMMRLETQPRRRLTESTLARIAAGFAFVWQARPIRTLLVLMGLVSLVGMPYSVLMPIFADRILHGGPKALGLLMGAAGVGALIGALALASRRGVRGLERWIALSTAGFGVSLILFALSRSFWLSAALLTPVGFCMIGQLASSNTLIQTMVPDDLRGRVMSVYSMMLIGMAPFGSLLAGLLAQHLGAPATVAVGGAVCLVGAAVFGTHLAAFRNEARQMIAAGGMANGNTDNGNAPGKPA